MKTRFIKLDEIHYILIIEFNEPDEEGCYFIGIGLTQNEDEIEKILISLEKSEPELGYIIAWDENMQMYFCGSIKPDLWRFVKYIRNNI